MKKLTDAQEQEMLTTLSDYHTKGESGNDTTFMRMSKCERYAVGQQWDKDVLEANKARRKFSLTINRIFPIVNQLSGFDAKNPKDVKIRPLRGGTQKGAELLSALAKHTMDMSHAIRQSNQAFEDGVRCARGLIEADVSYDEDPFNGDIITRKLDPFMVIPDPACKSYNYNDLKNGAKYIIIEEWTDRSYIVNKYPEHKDELGDDDVTSRRYGGPFSGLLNWMFGGKSAVTKTTYRSEEIDVSKSDVDFAEHKFKVSKYYWKTFEKGAFLVKNGDLLNAMVLTKEEDIKYAKGMVKEQEAILIAKQAATMLATYDQPDVYGQPDMPPNTDTDQPTTPAQQEPPINIRLIEEDKHGNPIIVPVLHRALMVGSILLDYQKDPFNGMNMFPIVRFSPYFVNGYEFSVVENLIGPQDQINWAWSMELNLIRKLANSGWKIAKDIGGKFAQWLQDHGSEDGVVIDESMGGDRVTKLEQNAFPASFDLVTEKGSRFIGEISQVQLKTPEDIAQNESGRSVIAKQNWSLQNTSNLGSNWDFTQELLGEIVLGLIRNAKVYSESEIMALVDEKDLIDEEVMNKARQLTIETMAKKGIPVMTQPEKPDLMLLQNEDPNYQKAILYNYKKQVGIFTEYMTYVDQLATPVAKSMLIDEISSMKYGKYGVKVELSPHAETNRMRKMVEVFELNRALVESGQLPVSRNQLVDATDVANKEEIKADIPQMPQPAGAVR
jgi:hypothetical protein